MARWALLICFTLSTGSLAHAGVLEESKIENWIVGAYSDNQSGQFSHCAISAPYLNGASLFFHINKSYRWTMGFGNTAWRLRVGRRFALTYAIDNDPRTTATAIVSDKSMIRVTLQDTKRLFERFQSGHRLFVQVGGESFGFKLTHSAKALEATLDCVKRYNTAPPMAGARPHRPEAPAETAAFRTEASIYAANVLSRAGISGFRLLVREEIPPKSQGFDAVWLTNSGLMGTVNIVSPHKAANVEQVTGALMSLDAQRCKGAFASGRYPTSDASGIARMMTSCSDADEVQYTIVRRPRGGFYVLGVSGEKHRSSAILEAGLKVHDAALIHR